MSAHLYRIGIDVGGTFTDVAAIDGDHVVIAKCPSTPHDPSEGLMDGLKVLATTLGIDLRTLLSRTDRIVHGTTVATNALLEGKGARVGLLATQGHRDIIEMREGLKDDRYNLRMPPPSPLVPRALRFGVRERVRFDGTIARPLSGRSLAPTISTLERAGVDAVAVAYLHSYANPRHEQLTARELARRLPGVYLSLSSEVLPQIKEYERTWTTVVNAYVGPVLASYLTALAAKLGREGYRGDVFIMQSHGGVAPIVESARLAAGAVLSGPAGGLAAARQCARLLGTGNIITFDMGGTSTDISLLQDGEPQVSAEKKVGIARIALPSLDIHTLGAGGGSVARVDAGRILRVGPESAGADPGPACYGKGGSSPTVTDANLVLGFLDPDNFLGGRIHLDRGAAERAIAGVATPLGTSAVAAAEGVVRVVNTSMAEGIKIVSVRRGLDPRRFALIAFGGATGLHVTDVARQLEIRRVLIPSTASVFSAWGMLTTDLRYELVRSLMGDTARTKAAALRRLLARMEAEGRTRFAKFTGPVRVRRALDMRYGEQIFEIQVPLDGLDLDRPTLVDEIVERFHRRHDELYAYSAPGQEVVIVNARVSVIGELAGAPAEQALSQGPPEAPGKRRAYMGRWLEVGVWKLDGLPVGHEIKGPAIVESPTTTILLRAGDRAVVTAHGWLDIEVGSEHAPHA